MLKCTTRFRLKYEKLAEFELNNLPTKKEKEYEELKKMAEKAGIADLAKVFGEYKRLMEMSYQYLQEMSPKYTVSTLDSST